MERQRPVSPLRVGIVGCGEVTQIMHLPTLRQLPSLFTVTALCDVSNEVLQTVGDFWNVSKRFTDYSELVTQDDVDVVLVANPDPYHAPATLAAIEAGKHVLVEKPMCITLAEADAIIEAQARKGVIVQVGYMRRYAPAFVKACEIVREMGPVRLARVHDVLGFNPLFIRETSRVIRPSDVPAEVIAEGRRLREQRVAEAVGADAPMEIQRVFGHMLSLSTHDLSAMREMLGAPKRVLSATVRHNGVYITATFDYGDFVCNFETGTDSLPRFDAYLEVYGDDKVVRVDYDTPYVRNLPITLTVVETNGSGGAVESVEHPAWGDAFVAEWEVFHANISQGLAPKTPPADFRADLELFIEMIGQMRREMAQ